MMREAAKGSGPVREIFGNSWERRISRGGAEIAEGMGGEFALCDLCGSARHLRQARTTIGSGMKTMSATARPSWKPQFSLRLVLVLCVVFGLLFAYAGSYYRLSRRGMREAKEHDFEGEFYYIPVAEMNNAKDLARHHRIAVFFAPANWVDQAVFDGPEPITWIDFLPPSH
jgi:hypothetical protein